MVAKLEWTLLIYVMGITLFALIPEVLDITLAYRSQDKTREILLKKLIDKASHDKLTLAELREFINESGKSPPGISSLTRGVIALTVILILGIATLHILVAGTKGNDSQIIGNILSMLAGLLAAITGFYFGGRAAETLLTGESSTPPKPTRKPTPKPKVEESKVPEQNL